VRRDRIHLFMREDTGNLREARTRSELGFVVLDIVAAVVIVLTVGAHGVPCVSLHSSGDAPACAPTRLASL
jgi:hypothetical protein